MQVATAAIVAITVTAAISKAVIVINCCYQFFYCLPMSFAPHKQGRQFRQRSATIAAHLLRLRYLGSLDPNRRICMGSDGRFS